MKNFNYHRLMVKPVLALLCVFTLCLTMTVGVFAFSKEKTNSETGYSVYIDDAADLLSSAEERQLVEDMYPITQYGDVIFHTTNEDPYSSVETYTKKYFHDQLGSGVVNGAIFVIDMDNREICVFSDGAIYSVLGNSYGDTITDNVYTYASKADYYGCASKAFEQIYKVLDGQRIAQPMKYICNAILAILFAMLINYIIISKASKLKKPSDSVLLETARMQFAITNMNEQYQSTTKTYSPQSSGSSGGGGGSHGGGGGGGGHSGGGGSHGF